MAVADTQSSLVIQKLFTYRGGDQLWTNRYHTNGPLTITLAEFETLADAVVTAEAELLSNDVEIVQAIWNDASTATSTNPHGDAVHTKVFSTIGGLDGTGRTRTPGDAAAVLRYGTDARSVKNKPIYLFNYYHGAYFDNTGNADTLAAGQLGAMNTYGTAWIAGFSDGTNTHQRCGPRGAVAQNRTTLTSIRHRDFPT